MRTGYVCRLVAAGLILIMLSQTTSDAVSTECKDGKVASSSRSKESWVKDSGRRLDDMTAYLEEFGTASISSPLLSPHDKAFSFELAATADNYYTSARDESQVKSVGFTQTVSQVGLGVDAVIDPLAAAAYADRLAGYQRDQARLRAAREAEERAVRLDARKFVAELPENATAAQRLEAEAKQERYLAEHLATGTTPAYPAAPEVRRPENEVTAPRPDAALGALSSNQLSAFMGLMDKVGGPPSKLANRAAINIAAGDAATEAIFTVLGRTGEASKFKDKRVMYGVSMVSVNPGWRTRQGYAADVAMTVQYEYVRVSNERLRGLLHGAESKKFDENCGNKATVAALGLEEQDECLIQAALFNRAHDLEIPAPRQLPAVVERPSPLIAAVSPMSDAEVFDDAYSQRQQKSLAMALGLALTGTGYEAQAKSFIEYAKSDEYDAASRQAVAAVNSYSHSGGLIGFQVGPRHRAAKGGKVDGVLDRQSFPVLMIIGMESSDLAIRFAHEAGDPNGSIVAYEPVLRLCQSTRWSRLTKPGRFSSGARSDLAKNATLLEWMDQVRETEGIAGDDEVKELLGMLRTLRETNTINDLSECRLDRAITILTHLVGDPDASCRTGLSNSQLKLLLNRATRARTDFNAYLEQAARPMEERNDAHLKAQRDYAASESTNSQALLQVLSSEMIPVLARAASQASAFESVEAAFLTRAKTMRYLGLGSCNQQSIPVELLAAIKSEAPKAQFEPIEKELAVTIEQPAVFFVRGKSLKSGEIAEVKVGDVSISNRHVLGDALLVIRVTGFEPGLETLAGQTAELSVVLDKKPVTVGIVRVKRAEIDAPVCGFGIDRDAAGRVVGVKLFAGTEGCKSTNTNYKSLLDAVREAIRESTDSSLSLSFQGSSSFDASGKQRKGDPK